MTRPVALVVLLLGVLLASCTSTTAYKQPTLCETVRRAVSDGSMPVELARGWYPECNAVDTHK